MTTNTFTAVQVEAALCVWEWMLEVHDERTEYAHAAAAGAAPWRDDFQKLWEGVGTAQMRDLAARVAPAVETLYRELASELGEDRLRTVYAAYDWEFVPTVCGLLDWSGDMAAACYNVELIPVPDCAKQAILYAVWRSEAETAAGRIWGYTGLVDDVEPDTLRAAFDRGDDPADFIEALGTELDLTRPDPMTAESLARRYPKP